MDSIGPLIYLMQHFPTIPPNSTHNKTHHANIKKKTSMIKIQLSLWLRQKHLSASCKVYIYEDGIRSVKSELEHNNEGYTVFMSPDKCLNSPHIPTWAHLQWSSVISTSLKSFNSYLLCVLADGHHLLLLLPSFHQPLPLLSPQSLLVLCSWAHWNFLPHGNLPSQHPPAVPDGSPADHSSTDFSWGGIFSNILLWGWCSDSYSPFSSTNPTCFPSQLGSTNCRGYS